MDRLKRWCGQWDWWGYLVVIVIALVALWPFLSRAELPQETDAELHIFRLAELSRLLRGGEWYPRWAPNFYYGYGYPIFNYYAPLSYYVGVLVEWMPGLDAVDGVKAVFELGMLAAALGMYGFVRDNWGREAGWVAAACYLYAPYVVYTDPHARGVLAESFSFGLFPLALWAVDRLHKQAERGNPGAAAWLFSVLLVAAIMLTHNLMAMVFIPILTLWLTVMTVAAWRASKANKALGPAPFKLRLVPFFALFLGITLAAFFWLPLLLEREAVNLTTLIGQNDNFDFRTHFLSLKQLLGPSPWLDWRESGAVFAFNLGIPQWLLGGAGMLSVVARRGRGRLQEWFFVGGALGLIFLMSPHSTFLWQSIPVLPYLQFPWRLLGPAAAFLAILAGIGVHYGLSGLRFTRMHTYRPAIVALLIIAPILLALPLTQPVPWPEDFGDTDPARVLSIERSGSWLGTTSTADFVPATVELLPKPQPTMVEALLTGQPVDRVNRATMPAGTTVIGEEVRPLHFRYTVTSAEVFRLRLFLFAFPGWQVRLDGSPLSIELGRPEGFITMEIPAGTHLVEVEFGSTPPRTWAWVLSGMSVLIAAAAALRFWRHQSPIAATNWLQSTHEDRRTLAVPLGAVSLLFILYIAVLEPGGWLHRYSAPYTVEAAQQKVLVDFGGQIALVGYDVDQSAAAVGDTLELTLYWQSQQEIDIRYQVFVHLLRADGSLVSGAQSDKLNPGDYPTSRWPIDQYVRDVHRLTIPADTPPGEYWLSTGLWVQNEGWRLPVVNTDGEQINDHYRLQMIRVE
ncbi:MAG: hypothetical protein IPL78_13415 [Chloroflexi bacterium]|nr:hypothetical protein [Chloroflexota bacterium]